MDPPSDDFVGDANADLLGFEHINKPATSTSSSAESNTSDMKEFDDLLDLGPEKLQSHSETEHEDALESEMAATEAVRTEPSAPEADLLGPLGDSAAPGTAKSETVSTEVTSPVDATAAPVASGACCSFMSSLHPRVLDVLYWRDVKKSAIAFVTLMSLLFCIANFSVISVSSHVLLALLAITMSYRLYKNLMQAIKKEETANPFKEYLEMDVQVSAERVQALVDPLLQHLNCTVHKLRAVLFVQDFITSIKYGVLFYFMSYVGSCFNMMTLFNLGAIGLFTMPKVYEMYKEPIDKNYQMIVGTVSSTMNSIAEKVPFMKPKAKEE